MSLHASAILSPVVTAVTQAGGLTLTNGVLAFNGSAYDPAGSAATALTAAKAYSSVASNLTSGIVPTAQLGSGSASSTTVLYGNQTWGALPSQAVTSVTSANGLTLSGGVLAFSGASYSPVSGSGAITTVGAITSGTWAGSTILIANGGTGQTSATTAFAALISGSTVAGSNGGTGVNNGGNTLTLSANLATSGAQNLTLTVTGATNVTLPTSGTLLTAAGQTVTAVTAANGLTLTTGTLAFSSASYALLASANTFTAGQSIAQTIGISSGTATQLSISGTVTNTSTSGYSALTLNPTFSTLGSGVNRLVSLKSSGNELVAYDAFGNLSSNGVNQTLNNLAAPTGLAITHSGTAGSTTYGYRVAAINAQGTTIACTTATTTTGNAALSGTNFTTLTWNAVAGATSYNWYGRTSGSELFMGTVTGTGATTYTVNDTGAVTPSGALPGNPVGTGLTITAWTGQTSAVLSTNGIVSMNSSATANAATLTLTGNVSGGGRLMLANSEGGSYIIADDNKLYIGKTNTGGPGNDTIIINNTAATGSAVTNVTIQNPGWSNSSGTAIGVAVLNTYNQTSVAAATDFLVNASGTVGSGTQLIADFQFANTSILNIGRTGNITATGNITVNAGAVQQGINVFGSNIPVFQVGADGTHNLQFYWLSNAGYFGTYSNGFPMVFGGSSVQFNPAVSFEALMFPQQAATASAPAYVKGGIYFDTTLNKLRIGGATAWETVTSV